MPDVVLEMRNIVKSFSGVYALNGINFTLGKGEIMSLVGENGAGKSTLMRILTGIYDCDGGQIIYKGKEVSFKNAKESRDSGISIIHQELNLFPNLSVAENILLENSSIRKNGMINWTVMRNEAQKIVDSLGGKFSVNEMVSELSIQDQQIVEIAKALSVKSEIIIMDEPTSALPENEVQNLFKTIRSLKNRGVSVIYVSHRLSEIFEICEAITVLRDGKVVDRLQIQDTNPKDIIHLMIGKEVHKLYPKKASEIKDTVLEVKNISDGDAVKDVSFSVKAGEILGLYGLVGSGATECPELIFGINKLAGGNIFIDGKAAGIKNPGDAIKHGIGYVPPDRHRQGIVRQLSIKVNISLSVIKKLCRKAFIMKDKEIGLTRAYMDKLKVKAVSDRQLVKFLSGGNQQKIVISKWLATEPKVLILNDPTRGVDVGAKSEIYALISELACEGKAVIITSSEMDEIIGMSDRIVIFNKGRVHSELSGESATQRALLSAATST